VESILGHSVPRRAKSDKARRIFEALFAECGIRIDGPGPCDIQVRNDACFARFLAEGSLGVGESYMAGWWDVEDLDGFITRLLTARIDERIHTWRNLLHYWRSVLLNLQRPSRAFEVGRRHYDIGNGLYRAMLDRRMIYSCGYWESAQTLDDAQEAKLELVFRKLDLQRGQRVLDIGCGWGGALRFAAERYGVSGVGITISKAQAEHATAVVAGLPVEIRLQDYRNLDEPYDDIFSIGMFEHVGPKNYRTYMEIVRRCLRSGGRFLLHTIGSSQVLNRTDPWIEKYIFPNSLIPSAHQIVQAIAGLFVIDGWQRIGNHYDPTLLAWRTNFERWWSDNGQRRDDPFYRMWRFYLSASAASFRARKNDVWQVLLVPDRT
jgi:cyclopropane-fatty-acyl-phospholipid synthase